MLARERDGGGHDLCGPGVGVVGERDKITKAMQDPWVSAKRLDTDELPEAGAFLGTA